MRTRWKSLFIQTCGEILIIGGTIAAVVAALFILDPGIFGPSDVTIEPVPQLLALSFLFLATCMGFISGLTVWICTMRRFSNRAQLYKYFTEPYIPVASDFAGKVFDLVYNAVGKPYRVESPWR